MWQVVNTFFALWGNFFLDIDKKVCYHSVKEVIICVFGKFRKVDEIT